MQTKYKESQKDNKNLVETILTINECTLKIQASALTHGVNQREEWQAPSPRRAAKSLAKQISKVNWLKRVITILSISVSVLMGGEVGMLSMGAP